jgi:hypothetical protein
MSDSPNRVLTGGCQCGALRYALTAPPERVHFCHCRNCQKAVGVPEKFPFTWTNSPRKPRETIPVVGQIDGRYRVVFLHISS